MRRRLGFCFLCAILLFILMISTVSDFIQYVSLLGDSKNIMCYEEPSIPGGLPDFNPESASEKLMTDRNIFFHETSCFDDAGLVLNTRQACAVESAAKMNPNMNVYLLFVSPLKISDQSREIFNQLLTYPNIRIRHINPKEYTRNTPLDTWYKTDALKKSKWPRNHMSDVLRYLTLWKYGGIYLDLDVVVTTSLEGLRNFAGAEDWNHIAAGVMGLDMTEIGRRVADTCISDMKANFRGDIWGNNGPGVITRALHKICSAKYIRDMTTIRCHGFKVFSPSAFYPVHYKKWKMYFETKHTNETMKLIEKAMAIHVWNRLSKSKQVHVNSNVPYAIIARKHCPKIFNNCSNVF
ncbi:Lactosylceramide 4-alpha-galactosyltransferase [Anthophora retusa]